MNSCLHRELFSDDVIGSVILRSMPAKLVSGAAIEIRTTHFNQGWLEAPRLSRVPNEREEKCKRSRKFDGEFAQIVEGILGEKDRQRELRRLRQLRYRKKKDNLAKTLEKDTKQLQVEINALQHRHQAILAAMPVKETAWNAIAQYFHLFRYGYQPPTSSTTGLAPSCTRLDFMRAAMDVNILHGSGHGVEALLMHWKRLSKFFGDVECRLISLNQDTEDWVVATTTVSCTITEATVTNVFPHLVANDGYCRSPLVDKLVGRRMVVQNSQRFEWDCAFGRIVRIIDQYDLITPMLKLLGNLQDVSTVLSNANIRPDFRFA
ncbi:bZIP transcription factor 1 [Phytophthora citrophthora]|uniref:BZIP transcription factor 1 n=1 Tax=Phytophthora citrophthora TaxID=4793 RepID=A0AAD9GBI1_9STRA|nr:bZIP transcription factor 1 [Phytophthora citrophthora]